MSRQYTAPLAEYYDKLNADIDYSLWCAFICENFRQNGVPDGGLVLDLACGTGSMTLELAERGYDVIAADLSPAMLSIASARADAKQLSSKPLFLLQDMRSFELYGTVDAIVSCLDSINYLLKKSDLDACFSRVANYLSPNGIFMFDVNTPHKFLNIYRGNDYILEADGVFCAWRNFFSEKTKICDFELTLFVKAEDGRYNRFEESQREKMHSEATLRERLSAAGLEVIGIYSDFNFTKYTPHDNKNDKGDERWYFVCKKTL